MIGRLLLVALFVLGLAEEIACQTKSVAEPFYPSGFPASYKSVLDGAHKLWLKDAFVSNVEVQAAYGIPQAWLRFDLYSPSTGATASYEVGGPHNGQSSFGYVQPINRFRIGEALPAALDLDLQDAIAAIRRIGFKGQLGLISLSMRGARGTKKLPAWSIRVAGGSVMMPLFINAQDGKFIPWQRASDPPNGSDAQLKDIWDRFLSRNKPPQPQGVDPHQWEMLWCINALMGINC